nr:Gfo/Idh/MocA family oxidoreductase [Jannaschia sp. Os4]
MLGLGYFARFHADAWRRLAGATLVATADADPAKGATHTDLAGLLSERLDVVDIATPPPTHAAAIRQALEARPEAIVCQKPFCTSLAEAEAVTAEAEAAGVPLVVHENFRFQPWWRAIRAAVADGEIGAPLTATFRLRPGDGRGPDAYVERQPYFQTMERFLLHETGVHYLDVFRWLLGAPDWVQADLRRLNPAIAGEDAGHVLLGWADGRRALLDGNRLVDHAAATTRLTFGEALVEGDGGVLTLTGDGRVARRAHGAVEGEEVLAPRDWPGFAGDSVAAFQRHVLEGLESGAFETGARDYLEVMRLVEAGYASAAEGRRVAV